MGRIGKFTVNPHRTKEAAKKDAEQIRKKGFNVRVVKAGLFGKSRGFKWKVVVKGKRKRR